MRKLLGKMALEGLRREWENITTYAQENTM